MPHALVIDINTLRASVDVEANQGANIDPFAGMLVPVKTVLEDLLDFEGLVKVVLLHDSGAEDFEDKDYLVNVDRKKIDALLASLEDCEAVTLMYQQPDSHQARMQGSASEAVKLAKMIYDNTALMTKLQCFPSMQKLVEKKARSNANILAKCKTNLQFNQKELGEFAQGLNGVVADQQTQALLKASAMQQQGGADPRTMLFYLTMGATDSMSERAEGAVHAPWRPAVVKALREVFEQHQEQLVQSEAAGAAL